MEEISEREHVNQALRHQAHQMLDNVRVVLTNYQGPEEMKIMLYRIYNKIKLVCDNKNRRVKTENLRMVILCAEKLSANAGGSV